MINKGQRTTKSNMIVRKIEFIFYKESMIKRAIKEARKPTSAGHTGGGGHAVVSDPTAIQGIKAAEELKKVVLDDGSIIAMPERWVQVINATYAHLDELERRVIRMRYDGFPADRIESEMGISRDTYYAILKEMYQYAIAAACQVGIVRVF